MWPLKKQTPPICYHIKFGSSASKGVHVNRMEPPKLVRVALTTCGWGVADIIEIHPSLPVILPNLVILGQMVWAFLKRSTWRMWSSLTAFQGQSRSSELIRVDLPSITYYWCSTASMGLSRIISEINGDFGQKLQIFSGCI